MPAYYHQYKIVLLQNSVNSIVEDSKFYDLDELQINILIICPSQIKQKNII